MNTFLTLRTHTYWMRNKNDQMDDNLVPQDDGWGLVAAFI